MEWRITFFVEEAERLDDGWLVRGESGFDAAVGESFSFVHHQDDGSDDELTLRVTAVEADRLRLIGGQDAQLRRGDILGGEVDRT